RAFTLRRDLAHENVARLNLRTDIDDAGFVEVLQRLFRNVRNVTGNLFWTKLRITGHHLEFLDVNGGEDVIRHNPLGKQDRILVVIAIPRHERDERIASQGQVAKIGRRAVGDDVTLVQDVTDGDQRTLDDAGILIGTLELLQTVDVNAGSTGFKMLGCTN